MLEKLLKIYPKGSDITLMNCFYQYPVKDPITGNRKDDFLVIVYKDNTTGKKDHIIIKKPKYKYYTLKPGIPANHNKLFIEKEYLDEHECEYRYLNKDVAISLGREADYNDAIQMGANSSAIKKMLFTDPRLFNADQSIEDKYRLEFSKFYPNNIKKINKAYFDIEVDSRYISTDFPEPELAEAPVNAISLFDERTNRVITFLLRNPNNNLIEKFENEYNSGIFKESDIQNFVMDAVGGYKKFVRNKLNNTSFELLFFDSEAELLRRFFETVYELDPDFIEGWNSSGFDTNYMYNRFIKLGLDPQVEMSDKRWNMPYVSLFIDEKNKNDYAERGDFLNIACNPVWLDQMIQFCSRRKAKMGSFTSFKLDDIGKLTAGVKKLSYSHITNNLVELPYLNYMIFVLYNIMDVIVQKCIENKAQDIEYIFAKCIVNNTSYKKGHRQTVYLINRMNKEWEKMGYIIGNNINKWNEKPPKFAGALVGDPLKTSDYAKIKLDGIPIMVCDNLQDYDFSSLYPSVTLEFNIAPNTQIGRINIWNPVRAKCIGNISNNLEAGKEYWLRRDTNDNAFIDVYEDPKYTRYVKRLYIPNGEPENKSLLIRQRIAYIDEDWNITYASKIYNNENSFNTEHYVRGGEYIENLVSDNIIEFSKRWLGLAGFNEFMIDWQEFNEKYLKSYSTNGWYGFSHYYKDRDEVVECPVIDNGGRKAEKAFYIDYTPERPFTLYKDRRKNINGFNY